MVGIEQVRERMDSVAFFYLAMAHSQLGEKDQARKWFDEGVSWMEKNKPLDEDLLRLRAEATALLSVKEATAKAKSDEAATEARPQATPPTPPEVPEDPREKAIAEAREAIRINKDDSQAHAKLGKALRRLGDLDEAITELQEAIRINKDDSDTRRELEIGTPGQNGAGQGVRGRPGRRHRRLPGSPPPKQG